MSSLRLRIAALLVVMIFSAGSAAPAEKISPTAETVNKITNRLESGENPDVAFSFPISKIPEREVRVIWLDPVKWIEREDPGKLSSYIGLLTFVRLNAPYHRVQQALTAYQDASKFTPGLIDTDVIKWDRKSQEKSVIIIRRKRQMPALLAGLKNADYKIKNEVKTAEQKFLLVRSSLMLAGGKAGMRDVMQEMEGFEYLRKIDNERTLYIGGVFTLPNTGIIPARASRTASEERETKRGVISGGLSFMRSKMEALDVRTRFFDVISTSVLEDAFQATAGLMKVTTDPRWRDKWVYQLTAEDTKTIFRETKSLLQDAKKKGWITFPS